MAPALKKSGRVGGENVGRYLLDTHAFLYLAQFPDRLPRPLQALLKDVDQLRVSLASVWEIQIKSAIGKLVIAVPLDRLVASQQDNGVSLLPISVAHIVEQDVLTFHHRDPFDRMLVAQARVEGLTLLSSDRALTKYDVPVRW